MCEATEVEKSAFLPSHTSSSSVSILFLLQQELLVFIRYSPLVLCI